jgi:hypothetical protein
MSKLKQTLAEKGLKLRRVVHYRNLRKVDGVQFPPFAPDFAIKAMGLGGLIEPRGGTTIVTICDANGKTVSGVAECHKNDSYKKKEGVKIAAERAVESFTVEVQS